MTNHDDLKLPSLERMCDPSVIVEIERERKSIRREVASKAMQGLLSNPSYVDGIDGEVSVWIISESVRIADELLSELNK